MMVRILIAAPTRIYRDGLRHLLEARDTFEIAGTASACGECLDAAAAGRPDVVVADFAFPDCLPMLRCLLTRHADIGAVVVGVPNDLEQVVACAEAGAAAVTRDAELQELVDAVESGASGGMLCSPEATRALVRRRAQPRVAAAHAPLTLRETEIAALITRGCSNKAIAATLHICVSTVKIHVSRVLEKLGAANRVEIAALVGDRSLDGSGCRLERIFVSPSRGRESNAAALSEPTTSNGAVARAVTRGSVRPVLTNSATQRRSERR